MDDQASLDGGPKGDDADWMFQTFDQQKAARKNRAKKKLKLGLDPFG